jgi:hypothetical protein
VATTPPELLEAVAPELALLESVAEPEEVAVVPAAPVELELEALVDPPESVQAVLVELPRVEEAMPSLVGPGELEQPQPRNRTPTNR